MWRLTLSIPYGDEMSECGSHSLMSCPPNKTPNKILFYFIIIKYFPTETRKRPLSIDPNKKLPTQKWQPFSNVYIKKIESFLKSQFSFCLLLLLIFETNHKFPTFFPIISNDSIVYPSITLKKYAAENLF